MYIYMYIYIYIYICTICRHACFGIPRLISAAWYTSTHVAALHLYT